MLIELPFVGFALLLPFVARGPRVDVLGVSVSESGVSRAWNLLAKGTLGVVASILLAATTELRQLLLALERLHGPPILVEIASFMLRYVTVVLGRDASDAGGPRVPGLPGTDIGRRRRGRALRRALFVRSYERGRAGPPGDAEPRVRRRHAR